MNKAAIAQFWQQRSMQGRGRWTDPAMLDYERILLSRHVGACCRVLDLGSGPATLSRSLIGPYCTLTAVDKYQGFLDSIPQDPRITAVCSDLLSLDCPDEYDLILLFGVVTHLDPEEELKVYEKAAAALASAGVFAVKNQVSCAEQKLVDGYSESLKCHYVGRYPDVPGQAERLSRFFRKVEILPYPTEFAKWPDTTHVCFLCSQNG